MLVITPCKYEPIGSSYRDVASNVIILELTDKSLLNFTNIIEKYFNAVPMPSIISELTRIAG